MVSAPLTKKLLDGRLVILLWEMFKDCRNGQRDNWVGKTISRLYDRSSDTSFVRSSNLMLLRFTSIMCSTCTMLNKYSGLSDLLSGYSLSSSYIGIVL